MDDLTEWVPQRKVVAAAIAVVAVWLVQMIVGVDVPAGVEGAAAVIVAYWIPNR